MSVIRPKPPQDPIEYFPSVAGVDPSGFDDAGFDRLRRQALENPCVTEPQRLLGGYSTDRPRSELFALLATARRVREAVDRLVVVGDGPPLDVVRCLFATCCHPFHNELSRAERGGRPRLATLDTSLDNDSTAGVLDLLETPARFRGDLLDRFAILAIVDPADAPTSLAASAAMKSRQRLIRADAGADATCSGTAWPLVACGTPAGIEAFFRRFSDHSAGAAPAEWSTVELPERLEQGLAPISVATLLPAAILGADVVRLLEGAVAAITRIREAPLDANPAAWLGRVERLAGEPANRLETVARWHGGLRHAWALPTSAAAVWIDPGEARRDRVVDAAGQTWPSKRDPGSAAIRMPRLDEHAVGQLLQTLFVATVMGLRDPA